MIKSSETKNNDIQHLIDRSQKTKDKIDATFNATSQMFSNAKNMLETLEDFDSVLTNNKERATKAQILITETDSNIADSHRLNDKIETSVEKLSSDLSDTNNILHLANNSILDSHQYILKLNKSSELNAKTKNFSQYTNDLAAGNEENFEAISKTSSKYNQLDNKLARVQKKAEDIVDKSQNLLNKITNSEHLLDSFSSINLGKIFLIQMILVYK